MNYPPKKPNEEKLSFVKITFSKSVTKYYDMFITGDMEIAIKLVVVYETIMSDLKLKDQVKANKNLVVFKKGNLTKLNKPNSHARATDKDTLRKAIK